MSDRALVVGAGLIGASVAWRLAQAGVSVFLVDAGSFGGETSSAGAGMLAPGGEFDRESVWTTMGLKSLAMYPAYIDALEKESGLKIDYQTPGTLEFAVTAEERATLVEKTKRQHGFRLRFEERPEGVFYPEEGYVDPVSLLHALRAACLNRNVEIREHQRLGEFPCEDYGAVVIAAGAWSGDLRPHYLGRTVPLPRVTPIKGHLIGYALEPGSLPTMRRRGHTYILQRASGFTVAGSNEERSGFEREVNPQTCEEIQAQAESLWPELAGKTPTERWVGFRPYPDSGEPAIGRAAGTNVWLAYGHYRNGFLLAPITAAMIGDEITATQEMDSLDLSSSLE